MKNFSILEQTRHLSAHPGVKHLGRISSISLKDFQEHETFFFTSPAPGVEYACLLIENALLLKTDRAGRIYAGFEKLSCLRPVIDRYLRIADISQAVFIFGEADWKPPRHPNIRIISLKPDFKLAREWFLIADSSRLQAAVVARDDGHFSANAAERNFSAVKTSDPSAVVRLATAVEGVIDWSLAA